MAINPKIVALVLKQLNDKKTREKIIISIVTIIILFLFLLAIPIYILISPLETLKAFIFKDEHLSIIESIKQINGYANSGTITLVGRFPLPIETQFGYTVSSEFGYRTHPITKVYKLHSGIDIVGKVHGNILSIDNGQVVWAGLRGAYGNCVNIKHITPEGNEFYSFYAHLSRIDVIQGQTVTQGQVIGLQGGAKTDPGHGSSTGSHLHFEIRLSQNADFQNPRDYIGDI